MSTENLHSILTRLRTELGQASSTERKRLEELAVQFEADHPKVGAALRELIELLVQAGL